MVTRTIEDYIEVINGEIHVDREAPLPESRNGLPPNIKIVDMWRRKNGRPKQNTVTGEIRFYHDAQCELADGTIWEFIKKHQRWNKSNTKVPMR